MPIRPPMRDPIVPQWGATSDRMPMSLPTPIVPTGTTPESHRPRLREGGPPGAPGGGPPPKRDVPPVTVGGGTGLDARPLVSREDHLLVPPSRIPPTGSGAHPPRTPPIDPPTEEGGSAGISPGTGFTDPPVPRPRAGGDGPPPPRISPSSPPSDMSQCIRSVLLSGGGGVMIR